MKRLLSRLPHLSNLIPTNSKQLSITINLSCSPFRRDRKLEKKNEAKRVSDSGLFPLGRIRTQRMRGRACRSGRCSMYSILMAKVGVGCTTFAHIINTYYTNGVTLHRWQTKACVLSLCASRPLQSLSKLRWTSKSCIAWKCAIRLDQVEWRFLRDPYRIGWSGSNKE